MDLAQDVDSQVFPGPQAQKERREMQEYRAMAKKDGLAPLDFKDLLASLDLQDPPVLSLSLSRESLDFLEPEESLVAEETREKEVMSVTVPVLEEVRLDHLGHGETQEPTAALVIPDQRVSLGTEAHLASMGVKDLLAELEKGVCLVVKERRATLTFPPWVWG